MLSALLLRLSVCFSLEFIYKHTKADVVYIYIYVHTYRGLLLFLCGDLHLHFGKLDADLSPTVTGGQGHATPL